MQKLQQLIRRPFPVESTSHPVSDVHQIAYEATDSLTEAVKSAQILWFTVSSAHHLESCATGPTDYKDDLGADSNKRLLFLLFQAARTYSIDVAHKDPSTNTEEESEPEKEETLNLPQYTTSEIDGEETYRPTRQIFVEQLYAISDPKQKIGYRYVFCLFSNQCGWVDLLFQAIRNNERRMHGRPRPRPEQIQLNPDWEICSMERFATLICDYLGNAEGLYHRISGSLRSTNTLNSWGNKANPLRVFSFRHSCKNLDRFNTGNGSISLSTLDQNELPLICQTIQHDYIRAAVEIRAFNVAIVFPKPDAVWEIDSRFWSFSTLCGVLFPGFESSEMVDLANQMRKCRISVTDASGRLGSDIAKELLELSSQEHQEEGRSEVLSAAIIHDNSASASDAVFGAFSRVDLSSLSAIEQFKLTSVVTRHREENKKVATELRRGNWTTQQFNEEYVSYRKKAVRLFERDVMVKNNKYLSRPERSVINYFLDYTSDRAKQNLAFVDQDFVMPVTDPSLTPAANYIKALMDEKEINGMSIFHVPDLILWTGVNDSWRRGSGMHMNFALSGEHGAGKSYLLNRIYNRSVPGVCTNATHKTAKSDMTIGNLDGEISLAEETASWMFGNMEGQGTETGDPTFKSRLTQTVISVVYFHYDKDTGERERKIIYAQTNTTSAMATNEEWEQMPAALADRFWRIVAPKYTRIGSTPADRFDLGNIKVFSVNDEIENCRGRFEQCMIAITEMLISTHCVCSMVGDVNMAVFHQIARHHYRAMSKMGVDTSNVRKRERVLYLARTLTIRMAIYWLFFQPLAKYRLRKKFTLVEFATDVEMLLVCTEEITNFAFELAASQFVDPSVSPVISCIAQMTNFYQKKDLSADQETQVLSTSTNQEMATPGQLRPMSTDSVIFNPGITLFATAEKTVTDDQNQLVRTTVRDFNYISIEGTVAQVADNIAAQLAHKRLALSPADVRSALRALTKIRFKARSRREFDDAKDTYEGNKKPICVEFGEEELFAVVKINNFEKNVQIHCGFMQNIIRNRGQNLIEEIISNYRHPKQSKYDTVSITSIPDYPNLMPRRLVRPNTVEEYKAAKNNFLMTFNPNALDRKLLAQKGLLYANPTSWRTYFEVFERKHFEFTRFSPETEVIAWHLTMCAHEPTKPRCLRAFPEGQRAFQRVASFAKQLLDADRQMKIVADVEGRPYTLKYKTAREAAVEAQTAELDKKIEFKPTYPIQDIVDRTKVLIQMIIQSSSDPANKISRIKHSFEEAIAFSGMKNLFSREEMLQIEPSFEVEQIEYASNPERRFDSILHQNGDDPGQQINSMMRKRLRDVDDVTEDFYGCISKQPHLLTQAIDMEVQEENQRTTEQQQLLEAAQQAIEESNEPLQQEETVNANLLETFSNVRPLEEPHEMPGPLGMSMLDLMTSNQEMVSF